MAKVGSDTVLIIIDTPGFFRCIKREAPFYCEVIPFTIMCLLQDITHSDEILSLMKQDPSYQYLFGRHDCRYLTKGCSLCEEEMVVEDRVLKCIELFLNIWSDNPYINDIMLKHDLEEGYVMKVVQLDKDKMGVYFVKSIF